MASIAQGEVSGGITVFGIDIDVGVKGYAGAVGGKAGGSISTTGVKGNLGGAMLFGGELEVAIDWSDAEWLGDAVDAVGDFAGDAVNAVGDFAGDVAKGAGKVLDNVADAAGDFWNSLF